MTKHYLGFFVNKNLAAQLTCGGCLMPDSYRDTALDLTHNACVLQMLFSEEINGLTP